jgi:hypothetical protein
MELSVKIKHTSPFFLSDIVMYIDGLRQKGLIRKTPILLDNGN